VRLRGAVGLIGDQQLEYHPARGLGAIGRALHLHAGGRRADTACGEHALAVDLDHAGAAIAIRPIAGLGRIAKVRNVGAVALRDLPDRLARLCLDFLPVEGECNRLRHGVTICPRAWSDRRENI
jgi:hypothetical protein